MQTASCLFIAKPQSRNLITYRRQQSARARRRIRLRQISLGSGVAIAAAALSAVMISNIFLDDIGQWRNFSDGSSITEAWATGMRKVRYLVDELGRKSYPSNSTGGSALANSLGATESGNRNLAVTPVDQSDGPRIALVVGNGSYAHADVLRNPVNDIRLMERTLRDLNFEVEDVTNATKERMEQSIIRFKRRLQAAGKSAVGLFFYSGHGVQSGGRNFLIPVDADIDKEDELPYEAVDAGAVLDEMTGIENDLNIVILDACRDNPFRPDVRGSAGGGLAQLNGPIGSLIAYSAAPGTTASDGEGSNSPYTAALAQEMRRRGSLEEVFRRVRVAVRGATGSYQTPWESTSLTRPFYFVGPQSQAIADVDSSRDEIARVSMIRLVQQGLNDIGFVAGSVDGKLGDGTRLAIAAFAEARGIGVNNRGISQDLVDEIRLAAEEGFRNFLGCRTEKTSRIEKVRRKVPSTTVESWQQTSERVQFRAEDACNPLLVCGYHYDQFERPIPNYGRRCDQACESEYRKHGIFPQVMSELESDCDREARWHDGRWQDETNASLSNPRLDGCRCPSGEMCYCLYQAECTFDMIEEQLVHHDDEWVNQTVWDTQEICECRSPEVASRECTVPQS